MGAQGPAVGHLNHDSVFACRGIGVPLGIRATRWQEALIDELLGNTMAGARDTSHGSPWTDDRYWRVSCLVSVVNVLNSPGCHLWEEDSMNSVRRSCLMGIALGMGMLYASQAVQLAFAGPM